MKKRPTFLIPEPAKELAALYSNAGFGLWLVGGWVRDAMLDNVHTDMDFATEALPKDSLELLARWSGGKTWDPGLQFGTVGAEKDGIRVEVTTFRSEVYHDRSRKPSVEYGTDLKTDLSRRDFTVNAMAISIPDGDLVDPFGGQVDLEKRVLRTPRSPEDSFEDDPLRMLRALRFVSTLGFQIDREVFEAIGRMRERIRIVSAERMRDELSRLMLGASPSTALEQATVTGIAEEFLPELPALQLTQDPVHRHKDLFRHTLAVLENLTVLQDQPDLPSRVAAVFHDVGKPKTRRIDSEGVTFHHHEVVGAEMAEQRLRALRYPSKVIDEVQQLVYLHMRFHTYRMGWSDRAVRRYVRDAGELLPKLNALVRADCTTRNEEKAKRLSRRMDELEARVSELAASEQLSQLRPPLDGREIMAHLGIEPGPLVGEARDFLMEVRLDEGEISKEEAYRRLDEWASKHRSANPSEQNPQDV
jgi:poly(A) polymerase